MAVWVYSRWGTGGVRRLQRKRIASDSRTPRDVEYITRDAVLVLPQRSRSSSNTSVASTVASSRGICRRTKTANTSSSRNNHCNKKIVL